MIHIHNGAVGYRLDYAGRSVVFFGDTMPCKYLVEACDGVDLLVHEVFPTAPVLSQKSGMPLAFAEMIVNTTHTSPEMSGKVFKRAGARLSAMWPLVVDHDTQTGNIHSASKVTGLQPISDRFEGFRSTLLEAPHWLYIFPMARVAKTKNGHKPKICAACGRPFEWRKKWERDWENVRWCSDACRSQGV